MQRIYPYNPVALEIARKSRGYTQKTLSKKTEINPRKISEMENFKYIPTDRELETVSSVLEYPVSFFYQPFDRIIQYFNAVLPIEGKKIYYWRSYLK